MAGIFDLTAAGRAKDKQYPASIVKIEFRENGGDSTQWNSYGDLDSGTLNVEARAQSVAAGAKRQYGMMITFTGNLVVTGSALRTAIINLRDYVVDIRLTDITGHTWTLATEDTGIKGDLTIGETLENSNDVTDAIKIPVEWTGYATTAKWLTIYSEA